MLKDGNLWNRAVALLSQGRLYTAAPSNKMPLANPESTTEGRMQLYQNIMGSPSLFQLKISEDRSGSEEQETPASLTASW